MGDGIRGGVPWVFLVVSQFGRLLVFPRLLLVGNPESKSKLQTLLNYTESEIFIRESQYANHELLLSSYLVKLTADEKA